MKAVYVKEFGGTENLEIREVESLTKPAGKEVIVAVKAAGLNRADIMQRMGFYPAPKNFPERILGLEFAGEVAQIGDGVMNFKIGDRVFGITAGGSRISYNRGKPFGENSR
jgi:NADPH:quinone reductase-like Zn-dependent oxidoreductase